MANQSISCVMQHVQKLIGVRRDTELTDGELLERFVSKQDEAAFETLVRRHGPLVQRVCRRILNDAHAAEDAFQATFLVLARKAASITRRGSVGGWLYEVAYHLAVRTKSSASRRAWHERRAQPMSLADAVGADDREELQALIDAELQQLPEKYRTPLVLCYLEGKTNAQAAREMGCPAGTMSSLLTRGRELLRDRLAGRGVALSMAGLTALLSDSAVTAGVANSLVHNTVQAAVMFAAGKSSVAGICSIQAISLAEGMLNTMISSKLKFVAALLLSVGLIGTGTSVWVQQAAVAQQAEQVQAQVQAQAVAADQKADKPADAKPTDVFGDPLPEGALARMGTLRWRHGGAVSFVGYAKEGKQLVTACADGYFRVWDVVTGKEILRFGKGTPQGVSATGLFQIQGNAQVMIAGAGYQGGGVALARDGSILAAAANDGSVKLWDTANGKELRSIVPPQAGRVYGNGGLVFAPDGKSLAMRGTDQVIRLYEVENGKEIRTIGKVPENKPGVAVVRRFYGAGNSMAFGPDGKTLATVGTQVENQRQVGLITIHDVETGKELREHKGPQNAYNAGVAFSVDGKTVAWSATDGTIRLIELEGGKEVKQLGKAQQGVYHTALLFSPDGKTLASRATNNAALQLWDLESGQEPVFLGEQPAAGGNNGFIRVYNPAGALTLAFNPDGKSVAEGLQNNSVRLWDIAARKEIPPSGGHQGGVSHLSVSPDGKVLTTYAADNTVRQWEVATGKEINQVRLPAGAGNPTLSANGKLLACGVQNNAVQIIDVSTGKALRTINVPAQQNFQGMIGGANGLAISPDGTTVVVRGYDQVMRVFDTGTGKETAVLSEQQPNPAGANNGVLFAPVYYGGQRNMVFSSDGATLATIGMSQAQMQGGVAIARGSAGGGNLVRLWNVKAGKPVGRFETTGRGVVALVFSNDGRTIVTANTDNTVSLWEILTGKECLVIKLTKGEAKAPLDPFTGADVVQKQMMEFYVGRGMVGTGNLALAPDGRTLAISYDRTVRLFELPTGKELGSFTGHMAPIMNVVFGPDSKTIMTGSQDTTAMVWAGDRFIKKAPLQTLELEAKKLDALWADLAGDTDKAYQAVISLAAAPKQTLALLQDKVKPTPNVDGKRIEQLVADLESNQFETRQKANDELEKLGELAQPALQKVLDSQPSLETRQRVDRILEQLVTGQVPPPEVLRSLRSVQLLEQMGSPEAKQVLVGLSKGAAGDKLTRSAEAALKRLGN